MKNVQRQLIDAHTHTGRFDQWRFPPQALLAYENHLSSQGVVASPLSGCEFDQNGIWIAEHGSRSQVAHHEAFLSELEGFPLELRALFWIRPHSEPISSELEHFLQTHSNLFRGLKIHPFHSRMPLSDSRVQPYLELADERGWVVLVHTAADAFSSPQHVICAARRYSKAKFIMGHMGLFSDNREAIEALGTLPNLFGDTAWVSVESALRAARKSPEFLLFGTDAPLGSHEQSWEAYDAMISAFERELGTRACERVLHANAAALFGFPPATSSP